MANKLADTFLKDADDDQRLRGAKKSVVNRGRVVRVLGSEGAGGDQPGDAAHMSGGSRVHAGVSFAHGPVRVRTYFWVRERS